MSHPNPVLTLPQEWRQLSAGFNIRGVAADAASMDHPDAGQPPNSAVAAYRFVSTKLPLKPDLRCLDEGMKFF